MESKNHVVTGHRSQGHLFHSNHCLYKASIKEERDTSIMWITSLPYEINNDNYFLLISFIFTLFDNFPASSGVSWRKG